LRRAAAVGGVALLVALLVVAATDAGGPWSSRLAMTAAISPLAGALGALAAVRIAASRGELRALSALGAEPGRAVLGAAIGGSVVGAAGVLVASSGLADLGALFPRVEGRVWIPDGTGLFEPSLGLHILPGGALALDVPRAAAASLPRGAGPWALLALAAAALACPAWLVEPTSAPARRAGVGAGVLVAAIVGFQGVAAGRLPAIVLVLAPLVLLTDTAIARYRALRHDEIDRLPSR
jgi:hypothetical protein